MSRVLIAGVCLDMPSIIDESMAELATLDEQFAEVVASFDNVALIKECVERTLVIFEQRANYSLSKSIQDGSESFSSYSVYKFLGVVKSKQVPAGLAVGITPEGRLTFYCIRQNSETKALEQEFTNLLLSETLQSILRATGHQICDLNMQTDPQTGRVTSVSYTGVANTGGGS